MTVPRLLFCFAGGFQVEEFFFFTHLMLFLGFLRSLAFSSLERPFSFFVLLLMMYAHGYQGRIPLQSPISLSLASQPAHPAGQFFRYPVHRNRLTVTFFPKFPPWPSPPFFLTFFALRKQAASVSICGLNAVGISFLPPFSCSALAS